MSRERVASTILKDASSINSEENDPYLPKIRCMDDVIDNFFNQIVQYLIEDMIVLEPKEEKIPEDEGSDKITKDYKELSSADLVGAEITATSGSKVILTKRSSSNRGMRKKSVPSNLAVIQEESSQKTLSVSSASSDISLDQERQVKIIFTNGNVYDGTISKRIMNGQGRYHWSDGTIYEGEFKDGFPTGKGKMTLPDLSRYEGEFNQGLFHGKGFLNIVSTPTFYSGEWRDGQKHGQGWLLYQPGDWYEGGWANDLHEGFGFRNYLNGAKYRGLWHQGKYHGKGQMIWENHDYYKGEWFDGTMHGEGEYIWKAFYNDAFAFPVQNVYNGGWENGKRSGAGVMHFGDHTGLRLVGTWHKDVKHGAGYLVCGNGSIFAKEDLFQYDKPTTPEPTAWPSKNAKVGKKVYQDLAIFSVAEYVDVAPYVDKVLAKLTDVSPEKLAAVRCFEEKCIRNVIVRYLPQLKELYQDYASIAAKTKLCFEPIMIRLFLWQLYKDKEIHKCGISLAQSDLILAGNPRSRVDSKHSPFEPIYFWQFVMSLIGVALIGTCFEEVDESDTPTTQGVSATIINKFFRDMIFAKPPDHQDTLMLKYLDLAPIKSVYSFYKKIGEPHSAKAFLRECCTKQGEPPTLCSTEFRKKATTKYGTNMVPLHQHIMFENQSMMTMNDLIEDTNCNKTSTLYDFRVLGAKNIIRCLAKSCPLIMDENRVVDIDYPLIFLEFYETVLTCIFMVLELELKREEKKLLSERPPRREESVVSKGNVERIKSDVKKGRKKKKSI